MIQDSTKRLAESLKLSRDIDLLSIMEEGKKIPLGRKKVHEVGWVKTSVPGTKMSELFYLDVWRGDFYLRCYTDETNRHGQRTKQVLARVSDDIALKLIQLTRTGSFFLNSDATSAIGTLAAGRECDQFLKALEIAKEVGEQLALQEVNRVGRKANILFEGTCSHEAKRAYEVLKEYPGNGYAKEACDHYKEGLQASKNRGADTRKAA